MKHLHKEIALVHVLDCCSGCKYLKCTYLSEYSQEFDRYICKRGNTPKNLYGEYECKEWEERE